MIIRSQDKNIICFFGAGCVIWVEYMSIDRKFHVKMRFDNDHTSLGTYASPSDAYAIIEKICEAFSLGTKFFDMPEGGTEHE